jgi:hypothetical protein
MEITFEKRVYHIKDGDDEYQITEIIKHDIEKFNYRHIADPILKYKKYADTPECDGFAYIEASEKLLEKLQNCINQNKDE